MDRIACVDVPALPLQLLLRRHSDWVRHPAAVVDRDKAQGTILWVNGPARRLRILPGMRYAAGLSLSRELRAGAVSDAEIAAASEELLERLRFFAAEVEPSREVGVFWLGAGGLSLLYPSLARWARLIREDLFARHWWVSVVVGFSRFGSYALAKSGVEALTLEDPADEERRARDIRLERIGLAPEVRDALLKLGIHTLGAFLDLPSDGVRRRFGVEVHELYQLAKGELWRPLQAAPPREPVETRRSLDHAEANLDRLMFLVDEMLGELLARLSQRCELLQEIVLNLRLEDSPERHEELRPARPTLDACQLLELVRLRLQARPLESGAVELHLRLVGIPPGKDQLELIPRHPGRDPDAARRAFARLRAEFGEDAVQHAQLHEGHLPEARYQWQALDEPTPAKPRTVQRHPLVRRLLDAPIALSHQRRSEPDGWMILGLEGGAVQEVRGPYAVAGGWWKREVQREYHFVRTPKHGWLWVYFDRRRRRWYLQGTVE